MYFTETWLNQDTPDSVVSLDRFTLVLADRKVAESGKRKGGGLCVFLNNRWCNPGHITVKEQLCSMDIELFAVSVRPYYITYNNVQDVWRGLKHNSGHGKSGDGQVTTGDQVWANELNLFFNRFDSAPTPAPTHRGPTSSHLSRPAVSSQLLPFTPQLPSDHSAPTPTVIKGPPPPPTPLDHPPPPVTPLPPLHHYGPGEEGAQEEGQESHRPRRHQLQVAQGVCRPAR